MSCPPATTTTDNFRRQLVSFITDLNIARRHSSAYPKGHPVITTAALKAHEDIQNILIDQAAITLGIAKDRVLIDGERLDEQNQVIANFARDLFSRGIVILSVHRGVTIEEIIGFAEILVMKSERVSELGGMETLLKDAGIKNLNITEIDYRLFRLAETDGTADAEDAADTINLWTRFIDGLLAGSLDPEGNQKEADQFIDPEKLAAMINQHLVTILPGDINRIEQPLSRFLQVNDQKDGSSTRKESAELLGRFILALSPEARRTMLQSSLRTLADCRFNVEETLARFPEELILEALAECSKDVNYAPPTILKLLTKLAPTGPSSQQKIDGERFDHENPELVNKFKVLFKEQEFARFVPAAYQQALDSLVNTTTMDSHNTELIDELKATLTGTVVEAEVCNIILELLKQPPDTWLADVLSHNLIELCDFFLSTGDFTSLIRVYDQISSRYKSLQDSEEVFGDAVLDVFSRPEFTEEVLNAPVIWGKVKFDEISHIIRMVGSPFIEPLLTHLAEENSISLRRFYMDRLIEMGNAARDAAILRLSDKRWFVVRNILVILRNLNDPSSIRFLNRLSNHPHPKVRQELTRTLIHFKDPEGDKLVLRDMGSSDFETRSNAIQTAGKCGNPVIIQALLEILHRGGLSSQEFEFKRLAVTALADTGNLSVLPELERILKSKNFFHPVMHAKFKGEILKSLDRYPATAARKLLEPFALGGTGDLRRLAQDALKSLSGKSP